jgi:Lysylphosphatidylglycerol synthase TM region
MAVSVRRHAATALRIALGVLGLVLVAYLIRDAGPDRVVSVLLDAGSWLPLILALEVAQFVCDVIALRSILGPAWGELPLPSIVRSSGLAYAMMVLLPAGRAAGEVARATVLSKHLGVPRAASASTKLQAAYLSANGVLSLASWTIVSSRFGVGSPLALLLLGNVVFQAIISIGLIAILWDARLGRWLDRIRRRVLGQKEEPAPLDPQDRRRLPWHAALVCTVARASQVAQYGVILHAVGGTATFRSAFVAHGIHLIGATLGDFLPNQLGVVDGAYRAFAADVGFAHEPARALSIAFLARIAQLICASAAVVVVAMLRGAASNDSGSASDSGSRASADAGSRS